MATKKKLTQKEYVQKIRTALDGRTQRWLCRKIDMYEAQFTNSMQCLRAFTEEEISKINSVLGLDVEVASIS